METNRTEVRIAGFGGQGVVLAGIVFGRAAMIEGHQVVQTQSYGAEARGGAARSELVIADEAIVYPEVTAPQCLVALSQPALDRYGGDLQPGGILVVDEELVTTADHVHAGRLLGAEFTEWATRETGRALAANMVMLGFVSGATDLVTAAALREAVAEEVPKGTVETNLRAVDRGLALGRELLEASMSA